MVMIVVRLFKEEMVEVRRRGDLSVCDLLKENSASSYFGRPVPEK